MARKCSIDIIYVTLQSIQVCWGYITYQNMHIFSIFLEIWAIWPWNLTLTFWPLDKTLVYDIRMFNSHSLCDITINSSLQRIQNLSKYAHFQHFSWNLGILDLKFDLDLLTFISCGTDIFIHIFLTILKYT